MGLRWGYGGMSGRQWTLFSPIPPRKAKNLDVSFNPLSLCDLLRKPTPESYAWDAHRLRAIAALGVNACPRLTYYMAGRSVLPFVEARAAVQDA